MSLESSQHTHVYCPVFFAKKEGGLFVSSDAVAFQSDDGSLSTTWPWLDLSRITANKAGTSAKNLLRIDLKQATTINKAQTKPQVIEFESRETLEEAKADCLSRIQTLPPGAGPTSGLAILNKPVLPATTFTKSQAVESLPTSASENLSTDRKTNLGSHDSVEKPTPAVGSNDSDSASETSDTTPNNQSQGKPDDVHFTPTKIEQESPRRNIKAVQMNPKLIGLPDMMEQSSPPTKKKPDDVQFTPTKSEETSLKRLEIDPNMIGFVDMDHFTSSHSSSVQKSSNQDEQGNDANGDDLSSDSSSETLKSKEALKAEPPIKQNFPSNEPRTATPLNINKEMTDDKRTCPALNVAENIEIIDTKQEIENDTIRPFDGCKLEYTLTVIGVLLCLLLTPMIIWIMVRELHSGNGSSRNEGNNDDEYYDIDNDEPLIFYRYLRKQTQGA